MHHHHDSLLCIISLRFNPFSTRISVLRLTTDHRSKLRVSTSSICMFLLRLLRVLFISHNYGKHYPIQVRPFELNEMTDMQSDLPDEFNAHSGKEQSMIPDNLDTNKTLSAPPKAEIPLDYSQGGHGVDVNMEAPISTEDLIHAGGLGARDDLNSFLPAAADGTDYEETLMETMDFEDTGDAKESSSIHPGLGSSHEQIDILGGTMAPSQIPHLGEY